MDGFLETAASLDEGAICDGEEVGGVDAGLQQATLVL